MIRSSIFLAHYLQVEAVRADNEVLAGRRRAAMLRKLTALEAQVRARG